MAMFISGSIGLKVIVMPARIIDGKAIAREIIKETAENVSSFRKRYGIVPTLSVILIGNDPPSEIYIRAKEKAASEAGIEVKKYIYKELEEKELLDLIKELNNDEKIHGILVQLPLPENIDEKKVISAISPEKDVDGFHAFNIGNVLIGKETLVPCTPLGIMRMLEAMEIPVEGRDVVIVNHSNIIGKPLAMLLLNRNATVTVCHIKTRDLKKYTSQADILVTATGVPGLIRGDMVKNGTVVIDAGIKNLNGRVCGDVDFEEVRKKASFITPVPGGVGPLTVAMVIKNTLAVANLQRRWKYGNQSRK